MWEYDEVVVPSSNDGPRILPSEVHNHLLLVWAVEYIDHSPTKFSTPDKKSDVIVVDVVDLSQRDPDTGQLGLVARRSWWRQAQLIQTLKPFVGARNPKLALMTRGIATKGQPPFVLQDMRGDQEAVRVANAWRQANPDFVPSGQGFGAGSRPEPTPVPRPEPSPLEQMAQRASGWVAPESTTYAVPNTEGSYGKPDVSWGRPEGVSAYNRHDPTQVNLPPRAPQPEEPPY